jgi:hypothetical protein
MKVICVKGKCIFNTGEQNGYECALDTIVINRYGNCEVHMEDSDIEKPKVPDVDL